MAVAAQRRPNALVDRAIELGMAVDAYSFAEWLVTDQEHYGNIDQMPEPEMEMAYEEAMSMWNRAHGQRW